MIIWKAYFESMKHPNFEAYGQTERAATERLKDTMRACNAPPQHLENIETTTIDLSMGYRDGEEIELFDVTDGKDGFSFVESRSSKYVHRIKTEDVTQFIKDRRNK